MAKHMFHFASAKETSLAPCKGLGKHSSNVCTHYEVFLIATVLLYIFHKPMLLLTYTALTREEKKRRERKEKLQLIHKRANTLYMKTTLSKAGPQEPEIVSL